MRFVPRHFLEMLFQTGGALGKLPPYVDGDLPLLIQDTVEMNESRRLKVRESLFVCSGRPSLGCDLGPAPPMGCYPSLLTAVTGVTLR